jgi:hypothetical protein
MRVGQCLAIAGPFSPAQWKTLRDVRVLRDNAGLIWARRADSLARPCWCSLLIGWAAWAGGASAADFIAGQWA